MIGLDGEAVVITGAGGGIGAAYARAAASAGAMVVVNDVNANAAQGVAAEICAAGGSAVAEPRDVSRAEEAEALIQRCISEFGRITGLVNNAAVLAWSRLEEAKAEDIRRMFEVNVFGVFNCGRAAVTPMLEQGRGSIINVVSGAQMGMDGLGGYGATKGAVSSFTYCWAGELRDRGIRVNGISPMGISGMTDARVLPNHPPPEANAPVALYLLSDRSKHITGQLVRINGRLLSLLSHPAIRSPTLERDEWTADAVAEAFDQTLAACALPTNLATYEISKIVQ